MDDFGSAQAESAARSIHQSAGGCVMGPGTMIFEITQAAVCLFIPTSHLYFARNLIQAGSANRIF